MRKGYERLSPGVYRTPQGELSNRKMPPQRAPTTQPASSGSPMPDRTMGWQGQPQSMQQANWEQQGLGDQRWQVGESAQQSMHRPAYPGSQPPIQTMPYPEQDIGPQVGPPLTFRPPTGGPQYGPMKQQIRPIPRPIANGGSPPPGIFAKPPQYLR